MLSGKLGYGLGGPPCPHHSLFLGERRGCNIRRRQQMMDNRGGGQARAAAPRLDGDLVGMGGTSSMQTRRAPRQFPRAASPVSAWRALRTGPHEPGRGEAVSRCGAGVLDQATHHSGIERLERLIDPDRGDLRDDPPVELSSRDGRDTQESLGVVRQPRDAAVDHIAHTAGHRAGNDIGVGIRLVGAQQPYQLGQKEGVSAQSAR